MTTMNSSPRLLLALCLIAAFYVVPARATTIKEFYAIPKQRQIDFLAQKINEMCDKLRSPYDSKGNRKSPDLLKQQGDLASFTIQLFETRDSSGLLVSYAKLDSLIYYASLDEKDSGLHVENIIATYAARQSREKLAADAAAANPTSNLPPGKKSG